MGRLALILLSLLLTSAACATVPAATPPVARPLTATPQPTDTVAALAAVTSHLVATAAPLASPPPTDTAAPEPPTDTPAPPLTPIVLSPDGCPTPAETYRNEVMGLAVPVAEGQSVHEPQHLFSEYGVSVGGSGESPPLQVIWLYQKTPQQLEALVEEQLAQLADLPVARTPVVVAGVEGIMLSPVPGEVAHTAVYLPVDDRLFLLLYPHETLDDAGRCLLARLSFFPPTKTLAELHLPTDSGVPAVASPVLPVGTLPADTNTWMEYHNPTYGFSLRYPDGRWTVIEPTADNPHRLALAYHELGIALRVGVARLGEEVDLQLYGGRAGDFVPQGEITFLEEPVGRSALVYQGVTWSVHYNDTRPIPRGDLLFSLALISNRQFEQGAVIPVEVQAEANRIWETFVVDEP